MYVYVTDLSTLFYDDVYRHKHEPSEILKCRKERAVQI